MPNVVTRKNRITQNDISKIFNDGLCSLNGYFPTTYGHSKETIDKQIMKTGLAKFLDINRDETTKRLGNQFIRNFTEICGKPGCMIKIDNDFAVLHEGRIKKLSYWKQGTYVPLKAVCQSQPFICNKDYQGNFETFTCEAVCACKKGQAAIGKTDGCLKPNEKVCVSCDLGYKLNENKRKEIKHPLTYATKD